MLSIDQSPDRGVGVPTTSFLLDGSSTLRRLPRGADAGSSTISQTIMAGMQTYTDIRVPALAMYALCCAR